MINMTTVSVKVGESLTIGIWFSGAYAPSESTIITIYIGGVMVGSNSTTPSTLEKEGIYYRVELDSEETSKMRGYRDLIMVLDEPDSFGVKKAVIGGVNFDRLADKFVSDSENMGYNMIVEVTVSESTVVATAELMSVLKGEKGDKGDKGNAGSKGDKGDKGDDGIDGADGANGADGAKGDKGDKGDPGEVEEAPIDANQYVRSNGSWVEIDSSQFTTSENVTSMFSLGGIDAQEIIPEGTTLTQFVKDLLTSIFYPTFVAPTSSLNASSVTGVDGAAYEAGATNTLTLTNAFNRGSILGKIVAGIWQALTFQDYRAGAATKYTIDGVDNGTNNSRTLVSRVLSNGTNTFTSQIDYAEGPQPTDSAGALYSTPLAAGSQTPSAVITAYYPQWYGVDVNDSIDTYAETSGLTKSISSGTAFSISFSPSSQYVYFITRNSNATIKDVNLFTQSISALNVEDGTSEFYKKSFVITLLDGSTTTLYSYRTRTVKTLTSFNYSIT